MDEWAQDRSTSSIRQASMYSTLLYLDRAVHDARFMRACVSSLRRVKKKYPDGDIEVTSEFGVTRFIFSTCSNAALLRVSYAPRGASDLSMSWGSVFAEFLVGVDVVDRA